MCGGCGGCEGAYLTRRSRDLTLENAALKVTVDPKTGCITSLYDKKAKFETLAPGACGNQLQTFKDLPKDYDAWNIDPGTLDHFTPIEAVDSVELVEQDRLRQVIRVTRTLAELEVCAGHHPLCRCGHGGCGERHRLARDACAAEGGVPAGGERTKATYEIPYGTIERPTTRNNTWEKARFEVPALRWADLGDGQHGFSLINESKYGYDDQGNVLRLSLLRSPTWPDPDADRGHHHFSYELYPHAGDWKQALSERRGTSTTTS